MKRWALLVGIICSGIGVFYFSRMQQPASSEFGTTTVRVGEQVLSVRVPKTQAASEQGLSGVTSFSDTEGMWWIFSESQQPTFWMQGMKIDLDFIWVRDGKIVDLTQQVPAPTTTTLPLYRPSEPVTNVLEVAAGFIERHHISKGMNIYTNE